MGFQLNTFEILRRVTFWRAWYDDEVVSCAWGGSYCLSLAYMVESVGGLRGSGLLIADVNGLWEINKSVELLGEVVKCRTLNGDSLVAESITSLRFDLSSIEHVESCLNQQGPPYKAKYSWVTTGEAYCEEG
ncbi:hypothetical protein CXB51_021875 [Gossypium anomalum]|uniref:Uncharacterized protein n=1 Tax=Gossypium anomalum TaxID=47600 RepID=A0A8J5YML7_9ROSI|nr:hypothetical protein CXB51_021875 [Gossypium anomalum]